MEHLRFDELKNGEEITVEKLAMMIGKGFEHVDTRLDAVDTRLDAVDTRLDAVDKKLDETATKQEMQDGFAKISTQLDNLRDEMVHRQEFDDTLARIKYIERKLGIESGVV